jgi:hypothetical protein
MKTPALLRLGLGLLATVIFLPACNNTMPVSVTREPGNIPPIYRAGTGRLTRWAGFENPTAAKGAGGRANSGWKGSAAQSVRAGETKTLLAVRGTGTVRRIWMTLHPREPHLMRALHLRMYWDGADRPAVSVPLGDFFGHILGRVAPFENEFFSSPEGRSFNCIIPMPFRTGARITLTNESNEDVPYLFYDIGFELQDKPHTADTLYFHAHWHRERYTTLGRDFEILPRVNGRGRYLGAHLGVITHPDYTGWWGEGEVKIFLDGDTTHPSLNNSGTEDYIGTAWGQGRFQHRYQGALAADAKLGHYTFYRYHVPDAVYFDRDVRVTMQQMGNDSKENVLKMIKRGVPLLPVIVDHGGADKFRLLLDGQNPPSLADDPLSGGYVCYLRRDDVSAVSLFYLDRPTDELPPLGSVEARTQGISEKNAAFPK